MTALTLGDWESLLERIMQQRFKRQHMFDVFNNKQRQEADYLHLTLNGLREGHKKDGLPYNFFFFFFLAFKHNDITWKRKLVLCD